MCTRAMEGTKILQNYHSNFSNTNVWLCTQSYDLKNDVDTEDSLPADPRTWTRSDVINWLTVMASKHNINELRRERFLMNGKALCLMTVDMYLSRVPLGGKLLYRDFQIRLGKAMYL